MKTIGRRTAMARNPDVFNMNYPIETVDGAVHAYVFVSGQRMSKRQSEFTLELPSYFTWIITATRVGKIKDGDQVTVSFIHQGWNPNEDPTLIKRITNDKILTAMLVGE